jgi:polyisoprenoid-binding protein YceI
MEQTLTTTKGAIDAAHSELQFKVKHLVITTVTGHFRQFSGTLAFSKEDFSDAKVSLEIHTDSVDTNQSDRDQHLKSPDFFDVAQHPSIQFTSESGIQNQGGKQSITGALTIKGITKTVTLDVHSAGLAVDPWGNRRAGFEVETSLNRKEFGLEWNTVTETGGVLVGEQVRLIGSVQFVLQA